LVQVVAGTQVKNLFQILGLAILLTIACGAIAWVVFWGGSNAATGGIVIILVMAYAVGWIWYSFFRWIYRRLRGIPLQDPEESKVESQVQESSEEKKSE
jgi:phosphotransferase system  glucose/maltose/N-acetylglucosamine-specific IIC component